MDGYGMGRGRGGGGGPMRRGRGRGRGGGGGGGKTYSKTAKLFVGNLPDTADTESLREVFMQHGNVLECDILGTYGFVHYGSNEEAKSAVDNLHETDYRGSLIRVELSSSKVRTQAGMGGADKCYRCGGIGHMSMDCPTAEYEDSYQGFGMGGASRRGVARRGMPQTYESDYVERYRALDPRDDPMYQEYLRERMSGRYKPYGSRGYSESYSSYDSHGDGFERPRGRGRGMRGSLSGGMSGMYSAAAKAENVGYGAETTDYTGYTGF